MQCLPKTSVLDFHPDTIDVVRRSYGFDKPEDMSKGVDILEDWVKQQSHFTKKDFSRGYLERAIIGNKGSIERAKEKLDKMCTYRTLYPKFFSEFYPREDSKEFGDGLQMMPLPKPTNDHYRVILSRTRLKTFKPTFVVDALRYTFMYMEYIRAHDYAKGYIVVIDFSDVDISELITVLNISDLRQSSSILFGGYEGRLQGLHIINSASKLLNLLVKIIKQVMSTKLGERIHVHSKLESVYDFVPRAVLPIEYGGDESSINILHDKWIDLLSAKEYMEYKTEMNNARTDESLRQKDDVDVADMGVPGTFRTLSVD